MAHFSQHPGCILATQDSQRAALYRVQQTNLIQLNQGMENSCQIGKVATGYPVKAGLKKKKKKRCYYLIQQQAQVQEHFQTMDVSSREVEPHPEHILDQTFCLLPSSTSILSDLNFSLHPFQNCLQVLQKWYIQSKCITQSHSPPPPPPPAPPIYVWRKCFPIGLFIRNSHFLCCRTEPAI